VIIKLTCGEITELRKHGGAFGERGFEQFMAGMEARIDETTGEIDIDRDDRECISKYSQRGHKRVLDQIFKRAIDEAVDKFMR
jgi:hypothetical protein